MSIAVDTDTRFALCGHLSHANANTNTECSDWAAAGECDNNANFMYTDCATSCDIAEKDSALAKSKIVGINSFYDLQAKDIDGNVLDFGSLFKDKVVVLTNVASYCGYTASHYASLVQLWSIVADKPVEILAFPCNQFGKQEPGTAREIKEFAAEQGVNFRIMSKINVNGANADPVYLWLKDQAGPAAIQWNFATYFVVSPEGTVESHSGVEPMDLMPRITELMESVDEL
jgi:glutathione peroxidase